MRVPINSSGMLNDSTTVVTATREIRIHRGTGEITTFSTVTRLRSIIDALNSLGTSPDDTLGILKALKEARSLDAERVVI